MKLIVLPTFSHQIRIASNNVGVRPMIVRGVCRNNPITTEVASISIRCKFNKLLSPIQESGGNSHIQPIFPMQRAFHKRRKTYSQVSQSKQVTPHKFSDLLDAFYISSTNDHYDFSNLYLKNITLNFRNKILKALTWAHILLRVTFLNLLNSIREKIYEY